MKTTSGMPLLAARMFNTALLIEPSKLEAIQAAIGCRVLGSKIGLDEEEFFAQEHEGEADAPANVRVIRVLGSLVHRRMGMEALSGLSSMQQLEADLIEASEDRSIDGILLDIDSPGGEAHGAFDVADRIKAIDAIKPVVAVANESAFSGGYLLASAARKLVLPRTAGVGSVGVVWTHVDTTVSDAARGVKVTHVHAGARKVDGSQHLPLSAEAQARISAEVGRLYDLFTGTVAANRGISVESVREQEAGLFFGQEAVDAGLADQVGTIHDAVEVLAGEIQTMRSQERGTIRRYGVRRTA